MKKITLITVFCFVMSTSLLFAQTNSIKVSSTGKVGINRDNPAYQLDIAGDVRMATGSYSLLYTGTSFYANAGSMDLGASGYYWYRLYATTAFFTYQPIIMSDSKYKTNIIDIPSMKDKIGLLRPVSYTLKKDAKEIKLDDAVGSKQYGFIAEELQQVFPELVTQREDGVLGIRYAEMIPVLVQAIREQQEEIEVLRKQVEELKNAIQ